MLTKKQADFELFKRVASLMNKGEHLTSEGLQNIVSIKASTNLGLSDKASFPDVKLVPRPVVTNQKIKDPY